MILGDATHSVLRAACLLACAGLPGCGFGSLTLSGAESTATPPSTIRQTDARGLRLPFDTEHPHRWSEANDGTEYEPCTAVGKEQLTALGIDPSSVHDAAGTDGQTLRGCNWQYRAERRNLWMVSQIVGNSPSLAADKAAKGRSTDRWLPDRTVDGRQVGVHQFAGGGACDTYVQSGRAAVNTIVMYNGLPLPPVEEICAKALEFTEATIGKMPR